MFIDLHMHEKTYSKDSRLSLEEIVTIAKGRGLEGICITDHDSLGLKEYAEEYAKKTGFPIFVGVEFYSLQGDIVAFGIDHIPDCRMGAKEFISYVKEQNGFCISAHPFRNNQRGLGEFLCEADGLDGVEVLNGSTLPEANRLAADFAKRLNLVEVGASDCHVPEKVGIFATYFPNEVHTTKELIEELRSGNCRPACYRHGAYHIWDTNKKAIAG